MNKRIEQIFMGLVLLIISVIILAVCATGKTPEDQDATAVVLLAPLGLYLIFSKEIVIV